ncbi:unnamed protein product [Haemonchus placei]|uniref:Uncharacterized protein n=1 Tax=Haemonchus placei TaxID=6290 RepID=A0A0N4WNY3_HAEPC|nr:unnamed protein product [Haemonchus placei]
MCLRGDVEGRQRETGSEMCEFEDRGRGGGGRHRGEDDEGNEGRLRYDEYSCLHSARSILIRRRSDEEGDKAQPADELSALSDDATHP